MNTRPHFRLDRSRPAAVQVHEHLRDSIISLALAPGTVLSRIELAKEYGLSSTPVRDALLKLDEEGLIEVFPQHATVVSPIDLSLARQAQFLRRSIELEVVTVLAQAPDPALMARLEGTLAHQRVLATLDDVTAFTAADAQFHRQMYEGAGVADLWTLVRRQSGHLDRLRRLHLPIAGKMPTILDDHAALLAAIVAKDWAGAQAHLRRHLSGTLANSDEIRTLYPAFVRA